MNNASHRIRPTNAEMPDREYWGADIYPQTKPKRREITASEWACIIVILAAIYTLFW